jgi:CheY-like chemotaxis protein
MEDQQKKQILIAEDDKFLSSLLKAKLEKEGFAVLQAYDGEDVLAVLKTAHPACILLDVIMPKISGFEVLKAISVDPRINTIPILMLTNLAQESDMEKAKQLGAREYLVKVKNSVDAIVAKIKALV